MPSDHRDRSTINFFSNSMIKLRSIFGSIEMWGKHTTLYFSSYLAVASHKLSQIHSWIFTLDSTWSSCRLLGAKKISRNPGQYKWVTRETRYRISIAELLKRNLMSQVAELLRKLKTMLKIFYFSRDYQFFQKSLGIKLISRKRFHLLTEEKQLGTGEVLSVKWSSGEVNGAHVTGVLGQDVFIKKRLGENNYLKHQGYEIMLKNKVSKNWKSKEITLVTLWRGTAFRWTKSKESLYYSRKSKNRTWQSRKKDEWSRWW